VDFIARLVALVPKPRVNLTRFHGVFAPNSAHRAPVTPLKWCKGKQAATNDRALEPQPKVTGGGRVWPKMVGSRRSGDEIHPSPPNGDLRPEAVVEI
jgi:hypothetical protein